MKRMQRLSDAQVGMRGIDMQTTIRDVRIAPISAQCKDGQLDGPLEFMLESTRVLDMPTVTIEMRSRQRFQGAVVAGERAPMAPLRVTTWTYANKTTFKDPATAKLMQTVKAPEVRTLSVAANSAQDDDAAFTTTIIETRTGANQREWMTLFNRPTGPRRMEMTSYRGATLTMRQGMKNGQQHGPMQTFPYQIGTVTVPGIVTCYEDGKEIKTTQCTVD